MSNIIEIKELKKSYGANAVLKGINLFVHKGEIFALLGANGAGKTTTFRMYRGFTSLRQRKHNRKWEDRYSIAVLRFARPYYANGGSKAIR